MTTCEGGSDEMRWQELLGALLRAEWSWEQGEASAETYNNSLDAVPIETQKTKTTSYLLRQSTLLFLS